MTAILGDMCNAIGGYIVNVTTCVGDVLCALIGR